MKATQRNNLRGGTALVIGGSISGMLSAKVLSAFFKQVIVVEKDPCPDQAGAHPGALHRKGLPQAAHQHLLLVKGRELFEEFFPGLDKELADHDAPLVNYSEDVSLFVGEGKLPRFESGLELRVCRRALLDALVYRRVRGISNIKFIFGAQAKGLTLSPDEARVTGLSYREGGDSGNCELAADLVVDCSGRGSRTATWLERSGFSSVPKTRVNPKLGYASRLYELSNKVSDQASLRPTPLEVAPHAPEQPRAVGFWPVDDSKWLLTLIGMNGVYPAADTEGFQRFVSELPEELSNSLSMLRPVSDISQFRGTENVWHRYDKMPDHPAGLLVMGDAMCAFNPLYGQGLSLIAMAAKTLEAGLRVGNKKQFSSTWVRSTYRRFNRFFVTAWMIAISEDMRWPETEGRNIPWYLHYAYRYMDRLMNACVYSESLAHRCLSVANMVSSPLTLIRPDVVCLALWYGGRKPSHFEARVA